MMHQDGPEILEQDATYLEMMLTEFVPYLWLHYNLTQMEQAGVGRLRPKPDCLL